MWLPWEYAVLFSAALAAAWAAVRGRHSLASACGEASWVFMLYAMWRWLNRVDLHLTGALGRGRWIWKLERRLGIGSERWFQRMVLSRPIVVQAANVFYATAHVTAMVVFLFWMFFRHRRR